MAQLLQLKWHEQVQSRREEGDAFLWSLIFAFSLFVSVVLHEFGHVLVAQSLGVKVRDVTLMILGGVSEMERVPEKPYAEFKISVIGPVVSFLLAGILLFIADRTVSPHLQFFCFWVGRANLALAVFNLLPAFPLDGGRVLRSLLATKYGNTQATVTSVRVARGLAWVLGGMAFLSLNFLLLLIAFFIYSAASSEMTISLSREMLKGLSAKEVGTHTEVLGGAVPLVEVAEMMSQSHVGILPVQSEDGRAGLVTAEMLMRVSKDAWSTKKVDDVMIHVDQSIEESAALEDVIQEIASAAVLPLLDHGKVVGLIRYSDVVNRVELRGLDQTREKMAA